MYKLNDYIVYKKRVCQIKEIKNETYVLIPYDDNSLKIEIPINNENIRNLITEKELNKIIKEIPNIPVIEENDRLIENIYKDYLKRGTYQDLIAIIKTTYLRNNKRKEDKKKQSNKDSYYFELAEKYLYNEFSVVLNKSFEETKKYVKECVEKNEISR